MCWDPVPPTSSPVPCAPPPCPLHSLVGRGVLSSCLSVIYIYQRAMTSSWLTHVSYTVMPRVNESSPVVINHVTLTRQLPHAHESCHVYQYQWVIPRLNESCHAHLSHITLACRPPCVLLYVESACMHTHAFVHTYTRVHAHTYIYMDV